jgi:hypothetical protein
MLLSPKSNLDSAYKCGFAVFSNAVTEQHALTGCELEAIAEKRQTARQKARGSRYEAIHRSMGS